jgi:energy-coupling factor transport system permease protein
MYASLYLNRNTVVHRLDPRTKFAGMLILSAITFIFNSPSYVGLVAALYLLLAIISKSIDNIVKMRALLVLFFVTTFIAWQFYVKGTTIFAHLGLLTLTEETLLYGLAAALRAVSLLVVGIVFTSTIKVEDFMIGIIRLGIPFSIAFVFSMAFRLVPTLVSTTRTIIEAQVARGLDLEIRNPFRRITRLLPVLIPFLMYALRQASHLSMALEARGFSPGMKRSYYLEIHMTRTDIVVLLLLTALTIAFLILRMNGYGAILPNRI